MTGARFLVGDVYERLAEIPDDSVDFVLTSPPFLALRSYLPAGHPDKAREIGSETTPADFLDTLLALTAEWRRVLAPHGSIAVELGDTYSGAGGAGGDYNDDGLRAGQPKFRQGTPRWDGRPAGQHRTTSWPPPAKTRRTRPVKASPDERSHRNMGEGEAALTGGVGWPMAKSLTGIPTLYAWSLAYGRNLLRAPLTAAELVDQVEQLVTELEYDVTVSDLLVHMRDMLAVHTQPGSTAEIEPWRIRNVVAWVRPNPPVGALGDKFKCGTSYMTVATIARDRYFDLDAVRTEPKPHTLKYDRDAEHYVNKAAGRTDVSTGGERWHTAGNPAGAPPLDWWDLDQFDNDAWQIPTQPYRGSHYATWPEALCTRPILAMTPRRVCTTCGQPSRRIVETTNALAAVAARHDEQTRRANADDTNAWRAATGDTASERTTVGWSDCGCPGDDRWRPGHVLDPFAGSGTTLATAIGHGRQATGIDLDMRNAVLAAERVGMWLEIDWPPADLTLPALPPGAGPYPEWVTDQQAEVALTAITNAMHVGAQRAERAPGQRAASRPAPPVMAGQLGMLDPAPDTTIDTTAEEAISHA